MQHSLTLVLCNLIAYRIDDVGEQVLIQPGMINLSSWNILSFHFILFDWYAYSQEVSNYVHTVCKSFDNWAELSPNEYIIQEISRFVLLFTVAA